LINENKPQHSWIRRNTAFARALAVGGVLGFLGLPSSAVADAAASTKGAQEVSAAAAAAAADGAGVPADSVGDPGEWDGLVTLVLQYLEHGPGTDATATLVASQPAG